jgi:hypothetical protein
MYYEERIAWAINWIKAEKGETDHSLAKRWGIDKNTVAVYCEGKGIVKGAALSSIVKDFGVSGEWLIAGKGEPFPGAHEKYPEICGPDWERPGSSMPHAVAEAVSSYGKSMDPHFHIEEAMGKAYKVMLSGTPYAVALYLNIIQFSSALDTGTTLKMCRDEIAAFKTEINELRNEVDRLKAVPGSAAQPAKSSD